MSKGNVSSNSSSGVGFSGLLTVVFIVLKLTGHINWSWIWVLAPIWGSLLLVLFFILAAFGIFLIKR